MFFVIKMLAFLKKIFTVCKVELNLGNGLPVVKFDFLGGGGGIIFTLAIIHQSALIK